VAIFEAAGLSAAVFIRRPTVHCDSANKGRLEMIRSILAVVVAIISWWVVATICNLILRVALPGYAAVEAIMKFTLTMMICRLVIGLISSLAAGFVCAAVAGRNGLAPKVAAVLMLLLFIPVHYLLWNKFPVWYHLFFLITLAPTMLLGAALRQGSSRTEAWATSQ
jgi:hypothetical protein